jgi:hypothetical protein
MRVAERLMREPWGIEIDTARADFVRSGPDAPGASPRRDARPLSALDLPRFRLLLTSPPYSSPGASHDAMTGYTAPDRGYWACLDDPASIFSQARGLMVEDGWIVVEASNLKNPAGAVTTLAWDIAATVGSVARFLGELVVAWELTYGYGYDHSYCLVFTSS